MTRGIRATEAGDYASAEAAFGEALKLRLRDKQVLAERIHERVLAGRNAEARKDFGGAWSEDRAIRARIYFDMGVLAERRKDELEARDYFTKSRDVLSTPSAMDKLNGRMQCPGEITRLEGWALKDFPNWVAAFKGLSSDEAIASVSDSFSEHAAKLRLEVKRDGPGFVAQSDASDSMNPAPVWNYALQAADGSLAVLRDLDYGAPTPTCGGGPQVTTRIVEQVLWLTSESEEYSEDQAAAGNETRCTLSAWRRSDFFIDLKSKRILLRMTQEDTELAAKARFHYSLADRALTLRGHGCNWTIPLEAGID